MEEEVLARRTAIQTLLRCSRIVLIGAAAAIQFVRPARTNPRTDPSKTLGKSMAVPHDAADLLSRGCGLICGSGEC